MMAERDRVAVCCTHLREHGYAVLESVYSAAEVERMRCALLDLYEQYERPALYAPRITPVATGVEISGTGLVFYGLLAHRPDLAGSIVREESLSVVRDLLGDRVHIELVGAVLSDETRPMFSWHTHVGAIDGARRVEDARTFDHPQRVVHVIYLHDVGPDVGELIVQPRSVDGGSDAAGDRHDPRWPGAVGVTCPAGSVVLLEERTWHCVLQKTRPGIRMFVGCYFAAEDAPPPQISDPSLVGFTGGGPLLQSVLPRR